MDDTASIRERVLRGIALNREPGFHFAGNFCEVAFHAATPEGSAVTLEAGAHCVDRDGQVNIGVLAMVADMAMAAAIRARMAPNTRLATVSMNLQLTGAPRDGSLEGRGRVEGFLGHDDSRQAVSRAVVTSAGTPVCLAQGQFMALEPPPGIGRFPLPGPDRRVVPALAEADLTSEEREILRHADATLAERAAAGDFISHFLGYHPRRLKTGATATLRNGAHIGNRVGHAQGGILAGFAAVTASAALPQQWALTAINACFVSPGQGAMLRASARVVHHGLMTAVVRTEVTGVNRRRILEATTTHARIGARAQ